MNPTDKRFPSAARAEDGMPITAGYVPTGRESPEAQARAAGEQPRPQPMRREVIEKLPRWAQVAFAARCARRVLPLYRHFRPNALEEELRTLVELVSIFDPSNRMASWVADIVREVLWSHPGVATRVAQQVYARLLENAALGTVWNLAAPSQDLALLVRLAKEQRWTNDTPVPPEVFGPMWQGPPPSWWRDDVLADLPPASSGSGAPSDSTKPAAG